MRQFCSSLWRRGRRMPAPLKGGLILTVLFLLAGSCGVVREVFRTAPSPVPVGTELCGTFQRVEGVGVLTLWGTPYERGFAHGRLLAPAVLDIVDAVSGSNLLVSKHKYEHVILPMMDRFAFEPDDEAELEGLFDGVRSALGDRTVLEGLGRPLRLEDLKACNTAGDWYRQGCSSFAAWGDRARDGHVWVGRNFDFLPCQAFVTHQMMVVHRPLGDKKAWAAVSAPGMIGCITGVNEAGVFASVHDVFLDLRPLEEDYVPRLLVLRRLMEACEARDLEAQALPILEARKQMFDNAILLAAPVTDGTTPALVFEYNGDRTHDRGVTVRTPEDNEPELSREMITCANEFRKRGNRASDPHYPLIELGRYRYSLMRQVLMAKTGRGQLVDFDIARKTMGAVRLLITLHTVIVDLNTLDYWFAPGKFLDPPGNRDFVKLPVKEWLEAR